MASAAWSSERLWGPRHSAAVCEPSPNVQARAERAPSYEQALDARQELTRLTHYGKVHNARAEFQEAQHSLIHARRGAREFEEFDVWRDTSTPRTLALVRFGDTLCGHRGIVHGGATAAVVDELFGWTAHRCAPGEPTRIFTATLTVDYKAPIPAGTTVLITTSLDRVDGRKLHMACRVESPEGDVLYAEGRSLFIVAREQS